MSRLARAVICAGAFTSLLAGSVCAQGGTDPFGDSGGRSRLPQSGSMPRQTMERVPIFFPPSVPPLDRPVAQGGSPPVRLAAPDLLGAFVNEPFYPQLGTRMFTRSLSEKQRAALEQYHKDKRAAQAELRAELERLRDAEPAMRREALEQFARRQTAGLAELEKTAEKLRQDLSATGKRWSDLREWHLNDKERRGFSPVELAQVMRGYAYYHPALLPAQRRLLREIALELLLAAENQEKAAANQPHVFFQPELARVVLPTDVAPELAASIAKYQTQKALLKKELFDAVRDHDGAALNFLRRPLRSLAPKQAARLTELETLAETIRVELAQEAPVAAPVARSPLSVALTARLITLLHERDQAEREAISGIQALGSRGPAAGVRISYRFDDLGLKFVVAPARGRGGPPKPEDLRRAEAAHALMSEIADTFGRKMAELINKRDDIRREAGELLGTTHTPTIDAALAAANRAAVQQQNAAAYRDYRAAVFEPGLSPEQRRLLLNGAVEELHLPLPGGELQPTRRSSTW